MKLTSSLRHGETFDLSKHPQVICIMPALCLGLTLVLLMFSQGTEVKAITYSNLQVHDTKDKHEVYVIVDI